MRESPGLRIIVVTRHTLLELLVGEIGDQFREDEPAIMHPPLWRSGARAKQALNSAPRNSNRSRPKVTLSICRTNAYRFSQSTLPDTSDPPQSPTRMTKDSILKL